MFVFAKKPLKELKRRFVKSIKVFFLIVVPLLVIAATRLLP
jgi:O-antigen/teichoic acid export membrane protein